MIVRWLLAFSPLIACMFAMKTLIHFFQLESYQFPGYFKAVGRNWKKAYFPGLAVALGVTVLFAVFDRLAPVANYETEVIFALVVFILSALLGLWIATFFYDSKAKKPLRYTPRVKRLYAVIALVFLLLGLLQVYRSPVALAIMLVPILLPLFVALGGGLAWPVEKLISECYFQDAKKQLKERPDLIKIGITGSYGKTSVKFILNSLLSEKYQVLASPASFNTPMGLTRVIRERLEPSHQVFIAEMGARHKGDIKELCRLVHPQLGLVTSVGPQHLETFKNVERIAKTKYELIENLPPQGQAFFVNDQGHVLEMYNKTTISKSLVSLKPGQGNLWAEDVQISPEGTAFTIVSPKGRLLKGKTQLLGAHNIQNILLAASVALHLGLSKEEIQRGISKIKPVEHRLQLIYNPNGNITVIDDAFNSNPKGTQAALDVLAQFKGRKIIITPGMVEMGKEEEKYNKIFGEEMASVADIAILIGEKHTKPIMTGLTEKGFNKNNIITVRSLEESSQALQKIIQAGDVILYENDLPDHYNEG